MKEYKKYVAEKADVKSNTIKALMALAKAKVDTKVAELHSTTKIDDRDYRTAVAVAGCGYELRVIRGLGVIVPTALAHALCEEISDKAHKEAYKAREEEIKDGPGMQAWLAEEVVIHDDIEANGFTSYDLIVYQCAKKH